MTILDTFSKNLKIFNAICEEIPYELQYDTATILAYYLALKNLGKDILILARNNNTINIPILTRTSLDLYVDVRLINKDSSNIYRLYLTSLYAKKKQAEELFKLSTFGKEDYSNEYDELIDEIRTIEAKVGAVKYLTSKDKYEAADCIWEYQVLFRELSKYSHLSIDQLTSKYISANNGTFKFVHDQENSINLKLYLHSITEFIYETSEILCARAFPDKKILLKKINNLYNG